MTAAKVKATAAVVAASAAALGTTLRIGRFVAPFATPRTWFYATNYVRNIGGFLNPQPYKDHFIILDFITLAIFLLLIKYGDDVLTCLSCNPKRLVHMPHIAFEVLLNYCTKHLHQTGKVNYLREEYGTPPSPLEK